MKIIKLVQTCGACPEQYDAYLDGEQVGYLRLRWGLFSVRVPNASGKEVLSTGTNGHGCFENDERDVWLNEAAAAILDALPDDKKETRPKLYEIVEQP
jgi:hypothetical protein